MRLKGRLEAVAELITCSGPAWSSAADLKFLHRLRQTHFRNFKSKSGTRIICLLVPLLLPKFVSEGAAMYHELRKRGTSGRARLALGLLALAAIGASLAV